MRTQARTRTPTRSRSDSTATSHRLLRAAVLTCLAMPFASAAIAQQSGTPTNPRSVATQAPQVQSLLLRSVTVTHDIERSLLFYRDILGQEVVEDVLLPTERARAWLDCSPQAEVRHLTLRGVAGVCIEDKLFHAPDLTGAGLIAYQANNWKEQKTVSVPLIGLGAGLIIAGIPFLVLAIKNRSRKVSVYGEEKGHPVR